MFFTLYSCQSLVFFDDDGEGLIIRQVRPVCPFIASLEILEVIKGRRREGNLPEDKLLGWSLHGSTFYKMEGNGIAPGARNDASVWRRIGALSIQ